MGAFGTNFAYGASHYKDDDGAVVAGAITATPEFGKSQLSVDFVAAIDSESYNIDNVSWSYGDGTFGVGAEATHVYLNPGRYTVNATIEVSQDGGVSPEELTASLDINVYEKIACYLLDKCYRYGFNNMTQGYGFSEFKGNDWPFPPVAVGGSRCVDDLNQVHQVVFDNISGTFREIGIIEGPSGSNLNLKFTDENNEGTQSEIAGSIEFPEVTGSAEEDKIEHGASYVNMRPFSESNKAATGYTADGYRSAQKIDMTLYMDGDTTKPYQTVDMPAKAEINFGRRAQGRRGRMKLDFAASEIIFTKHRQLWVAKAKAGPLAGRDMTEQGYQEQLASPVLWTSRSHDNFFKNLATEAPIKVSNPGTTARDATAEDVVLIEGPDSNVGSAIRFSDVMNMGSIAVSTSTDIKILFWSKSTPAWNIWVLFSAGSPAVFIAGEFELIGTIGSWNLYSLSYDFGDLIPVGVVIYPAVSSPDSNSMNLFDFRFYTGTTEDAGVSDDAVLAYFNAVKNNQGNSYLPLFP